MDLKNTRFVARINLKFGRSYDVRIFKILFLKRASVKILRGGGGEFSEDFRNFKVKVSQIQFSQARFSAIFINGGCLLHMGKSGAVSRKNSPGASYARC